MAELVFTDCYFAIDDTSGSKVELSDHVKSVKVDYKAEIHDLTEMGDSSRARYPGLKDWTMTVELFQDYAADKTDAVAFGLIGSTTARSIGVRPVNTSIAATNPQYQGNMYLESYSPCDATVGELGTVTYNVVGSGTLSRLVVASSAM